MNQLMKRVLSVLLVVCLLCSALPSAGPWGAACGCAT